MGAHVIICPYWHKGQVLGVHDYLPSQTRNPRDMEKMVHNETTENEKPGIFCLLQTR